MDILEKINNSNLSEALEIAKNLDCRVSFKDGRKFSYEGYDGSVTYNQIVHAIYEKVNKWTFSPSAKRSYVDLVQLDLKGEKELEKANVFVRVLTRIKRLFNSGQRTHEMQKLEGLQSGWSVHELRKQYLEANSSKILNVVNSFLGEQPLVPYPISPIHTGVVGSEVGVTITVSKFPLEWRRYESPKIVFDGSRTDEGHLEQLLEEIKTTFPAWVQIKESFQEIFKERPIQEYLENHEMFKEAQKGHKNVKLHSSEVVDVKWKVGDNGEYVADIHCSFSFLDPNLHRSWKLPYNCNFSIPLKEIQQDSLKEKLEEKIKSPREDGYYLRMKDGEPRKMTHYESFLIDSFKDYLDPSFCTLVVGYQEGEKGFIIVEDPQDKKS